MAVLPILSTSSCPHQTAVGIETRKGLLEGLLAHPDISSWLERERPRIDRWIAAERRRETDQAESFE